MNTQLSPLDNRRLRARKPTLEDRRGERVLLVWGELACWMVVDGELNNFLGLFNGRRTLKQVLQRHARSMARPRGEVDGEARGVVQQLLAKGILHSRGAAPEVEPESLGLANITVNLTNRCNLRCGWCYNGDRATAEMPVGRLMDAVQQGRDVIEPNASFIILGGEPLLCLDRLLEAVDRASELFRPATLVSTNGTLLSQETVAALATRRLEVQVSLDSHRAAKHDLQRGPGVYGKAMTGIGRLVRAGVHVTLCQVYTAETSRDFEAYLDLALEMGVAEARFIPLRLIGRGGAHQPACPDQAASFARLIEILQRRPELRPLLLRDYFSILQTICRFSTPRTGCGIGRKVIFIDADGIVYPCPNHVGPEHACGSLQQASLAEIARDSPMMRAMRRQYQVSRYTRCKTCPFRYWCAGDCRGEVLAHSGDPLEPSPHCDELRKMYVEMIWLIADNDQSLGTTRDLGAGRRPEDQYQV